MEKAHIRLPLDKMSVPQLTVFGRKIAQGLLNSSLTDKAAMATAITNATNELADNETAAKLKASEAEAATKTRNTSIAGFDEVMQDTAATVEKVTAFNGAAMQDIGYELASTNRASAVMTKVTGLQISPGDRPGQLHPHWNPMAGSRSFEVQYLASETLLGDDAAWKTGAFTTESRGEVNDLPSHQLVWLRVRAIGAGKGNVGPWSDAVSMSAQ